MPDIMEIIATVEQVKETQETITNTLLAIKSSQDGMAGYLAELKTRTDTHAGQLGMLKQTEETAVATMTYVEASLQENASGLAAAVSSDSPIVGVYYQAAHEAQEAGLMFVAAGQELEQASGAVAATKSHLEDTMNLVQHSGNRIAGAEAQMQAVAEKLENLRHSLQAIIS